ncbi:hypothetical protein GCM10023189_44570 [Nibrella saemangeumensis]|uniref:DUF3945 domain-containing protein n=1 Tax=Nibrella saemangeumensis TaxID=1084526 RepID=A0ABP8NCC9_9BACT
MNENAYARTQADGLDNIAPTPLQAGQAWQYAVTDGFVSAEEASAVLRRQLEADRSVIEKQLANVGITKEVLTANPDLEKVLFSGQRTELVTIRLSDDLELTGRLRLVITPSGPDLRITPYYPNLTIPEKVEGYQVTPLEKEELTQYGATQRPMMLLEPNGSYVPAYLRVDPLTNTVDLWRVREDQMPRKLMGVDLTRDQQLSLAGGFPVKLEGLKDGQGESYTATVSLSVAQKALHLSEVTPQINPDQKHKEQLAQNNHGAKTDQTRHLESEAGHTTVSNAQKETIQRLMNTDTNTQQASPGTRQKR